MGHSVYMHTHDTFRCLWYLYAIRYEYLLIRFWAKYGTDKNYDMS